MTDKPTPPAAGLGTSRAGDTRPGGMSDIVLRIATLPANPVTRARQRVEQEVPAARRGPGWERHWRELEAYVESLAEWQGVGTTEEDNSSAS